MASYDDTATISGSVATFTNGADEVYCKSVKATLPASLEGYDSVTIGSFGKNITDLSTYVDGYVNSNGTFNTSHTQGEMRSDFIRVEPNTKYCFHIVKTTGTYTAGIYIGFYSAPNVESFISRTSTGYITTPATAKYVVLSARNLATATQIQFELGNKNTGYEPCEYRSYEVPLERTIYGGEVELVGGSGKETHKEYTASDVTALYWNNHKDQQVDTNHRACFRITLPSGYITQNNSMCNALSYSTSIGGGQGSAEGYQIIPTAGIYFCIDLADIGMENATSSTPDSDFLDAIRNYGDNLKFVVELSTPTDFTFAGGNIPTRFGDNSIYNELDYTNNLEVTYYKRGYGYSSATLNRAVGKNLFDMVCYYGGAYNPSVGAQWDLKVNIAQFTDNGDGSFSLTAAGSGYTYTFLIPVRHGVDYHFKMTFTSTGTGGLTLGYLDGTYKVLSNTTSTAVPNNVDTNLTPPTDARYYYIVVTNRTTAGATISMVNPQMEFGSSASQYEPYVAPISQTAKFHRIIYGGTADVVKGTCEPKNLFNEDWEVGGINDTTGIPNSETNKIRSKTFSRIKGGVTCYVGAPNNIRVLFYASDESFISETANIRNASFSVPANCTLFKIRGTVDYGTTYNDDIIICYGSSASEYTPYFEPFNFTPVNFNTVEGENTLYASEGDSAITYRKETT